MLAKPHPEQVPWNMIADFFCRDDNRRLTPGKTDTITRNRQKVQKRFLNSSVNLLYKNSQVKITTIDRTTFYANRSFFVVKPRINDRGQCPWNVPTLRWAYYNIVNIQYALWIPVLSISLKCICIALLSISEIWLSNNSLYA